MAILLEMAEGSNDVVEWQRFVERRRALTDRMSLRICDGCDGCGLRCTDGISVTQEEWAAARKHWTALPPKERERLALQERRIPWPGAEDSGVVVEVCPFRDTERGRCAIYPARPTVCRLMGHTEWLPCPIETVPSVPDGGAQLWHEYLAFERRTWKQWDAVQEALEAADPA